MSGLPIALVGLLLLAAGWPEGARAWSASSHRDVADAAVRWLEPAHQEEAARHRLALLRGAAAPDRRGAGWIPPWAHVLHPEEDPDGGLAAAAVEGLVAWLARTRPRDARWWFHAGRLSHLLADLNQPMHAATSPEERRVHSRYERWATRLHPADLRATGPGATTPGAEEGGREDRLPDRKRLVALARRGARRYRPLLDALGDGPQADLEGPTRRWLGEAVEETAHAWRALLAGRGRGRSHRGWALVVLLWFVLLARRRGRLPPGLRG